MNLAIWKHRNPFNGELTRLREEMDRTIDRLMGTSFIEPKATRLEGWAPLVDVSETDGEVLVRAEVPGIEASDLDVSISGNSLMISGSKKEEKEKSGEDFYQCERRFGAFRRLVELPESIDPDKVTADTEAGVVTVRIGKRSGVKARHVPIRASNGRRTGALVG
jgi:HSP20 family protein